MAAGTEASGTGASTVRIPSTDREDTILVASTSAGSLNKKQTDGNNRAGRSPASVSTPSAAGESQYQCLLCIPVFPCETSGDESVLVRPLLVLPWGEITVYGGWDAEESSHTEKTTQRGN